MPQKKLYNHCKSQLDHTLEILEIRKAEILIALESESKSSAGDKHETGRTMMQLEEQKATVQLYAALEVKQTLNQLDVEMTNTQAGLGSLVRCDTGSYFIAISAGKLVIEGTKYYGISLPSPIGLILAGKSAGDEVKYNGKVMKILEMC